MYFFIGLPSASGDMPFSAGLPRAFAAEAAVLGLGDADQALLGHGVDRVVVRLAAEDELMNAFDLWNSVSVWCIGMCQLRVTDCCEPKRKFEM
jgi:hypothetical protein